TANVVGRCAGVDDHARHVASVAGEPHCAELVGADVVADDVIPHGRAPRDLHSSHGIAGDDVARPFKAAADKVVLRTAVHDNAHHVAGVTDGERGPGRVGADIIAEYAIQLGPVILDLPPGLTVAGDDVAHSSLAPADGIAL